MKKLKKLNKFRDISGNLSETEEFKIESKI